MMKNNIIHKLRKDTWKGTLLPVEYTSKEYYDVNMQRIDDGFQISIQKIYETLYAQFRGLRIS